MLRKSSLSLVFVLLPRLASASSSEFVRERVPYASLEEHTVASDAQAPPEQPDFTTHPFVLQLRSGVATSVGFVGALAELNVHDRLALNAGVGSNFYGLSSAFGVRLRPLIFTSSLQTRAPTVWAVTLEGSLSHGAVAPEPDLIPCIDDCRLQSSVVARSVNWGQLELGVEMRSGHYQFLGSLGWASMLGNPRFTCVYDDGTGPAFDCTNDQRVSTRTFVVTFAAGYAF